MRKPTVDERLQSLQYQIERIERLRRIERRVDRLLRWWLYTTAIVVALVLLVWVVL